MNTEFQEPPSATPEATGTAANEAEALLKDLVEQKDLHLRLAADFDNFKKRSRQESEARAVAQKESFIVELLPVIDNLEPLWPLAHRGTGTWIESPLLQKSARQFL